LITSGIINDIDDTEGFMNSSSSNSSITNDKRVAESVAGETTQSTGYNYNTTLDPVDDPTNTTTSNTTVVGEDFVATTSKNDVAYKSHRNDVIIENATTMKDSSFVSDLLPAVNTTRTEQNSRNYTNSSGNDTIIEGDVENEMKEHPKVTLKKKLKKKKKKNDEKSNLQNSAALESLDKDNEKSRVEDTNNTHHNSKQYEETAKSNNAAITSTTATTKKKGSYFSFGDVTKNATKISTAATTKKKGSDFSSGDLTKTVVTKDADGGNTGSLESDKTKKKKKKDSEADSTTKKRFEKESSKKLSLRGSNKVEK